MREAGVLPFFRACAALAPCFVSLGNHEWVLTAADLALLESCGVSVLDNTFTTASLRNHPLVIGGLSSARVSEYRRALHSGLEPLEANAPAITFCCATTRSITRAGLRGGTSI